MMNLRPYQNEAKLAILEQWSEGINKVLAVLPTGTGKTILFSAVTEECVRQGKRVLILAHRGELLDQAADKLMKSTGLGCATEKAEQSCLGSWYRVVVGSVQTLMREKRLKGFSENTSIPLSSTRLITLSQTAIRECLTIFLKLRYLV